MLEIIGISLSIVSFSILIQDISDYITRQCLFNFKFFFKVRLELHLGDTGEL